MWTIRTLFITLPARFDSKKHPFLQNELDSSWRLRFGVVCIGVVIAKKHEVKGAMNPF